MLNSQRFAISIAKSFVIILLLTIFITFSIDIVPAVEPDEMTSFPELYMPALRAVLYYITPIPFYAIAQQFDTVKRKELLATYKGLEKNDRSCFKRFVHFPFGAIRSACCSRFLPWAH